MSSSAAKDLLFRLLLTSKAPLWSRHPLLNAGYYCEQREELCTPIAAKRLFTVGAVASPPSPHRSFPLHNRIDPPHPTRAPTPSSPPASRVSRALRRSAHRCV